MSPLTIDWFMCAFLSGLVAGLAIGLFGFKAGGGRA